MTRKEALEIYKVQHERFRQTKELQWKITLASWALIAIAITYSDKFKKLSEIQILLLCAIFWIAQMIFAWRTQRALEVDKTISKHILESLSNNTQDINIEVKVDELSRNVKYLATGKWWIFFQALTTGILLGILVMTHYANK